MMVIHARLCFYHVWAGNGNSTDPEDHAEFIGNAPIWPVSKSRHFASRQPRRPIWPVFPEKPQRTRATAHGRFDVSTSPEEELRSKCPTEPSNHRPHEQQYLQNIPFGRWDPNYRL
jgi:hypothetical protein